MESSSGRGVSTSVDGFGTPGTRGSPESVRKYTKRAIGPRAPYTHKKNRPRASAVVGLLSTSSSGVAVNEIEEDPVERGRPLMAAVSSTSGAVAASIPLLYGPDGSIDLDRLTEDERRALLRPADLDDWPDVLTPFVQSVLPLHTDVQPIAQTLARPIKETVDGFGSAVLSEPASISCSFTYNVHGLSIDQQKSPFAISSGHVFERPSSRGESIPLAWPRPTHLSGSTSSTSVSSPAAGTAGDSSGAPIRTLKGRDREKEREAAGVGNLDDWTFSRAHMAKLLEPLDLGLYPGLLPAAWINHIRSSKGGPAKSRLPPYHLSMGPTFENALQDELTSMAHRVLLNGKPGAVNSNAAQAEPFSSDPCTSISQAASQDWKLGREEEQKAGVRASDVVRETVYGGAVGEAYASSVFSFVSGAARSAQSRQDEAEKEGREEDGKSKSIQRQRRASPVKAELSRVVPSYFDEAGEMLDEEGYIGMSMIPLEVRKEAGLSGHAALSRKGTPTLRTSSPEDRWRKRSRDPSVTFSAKRRRMASTPTDERMDVTMDCSGDAGEAGEQAPDRRLDGLASAYHSGAILEKSLVEHVRDSIISPLTGARLELLVRAGDEVMRLQRQKAEAEGEADEKSRLSNLLDHVGSLADDLEHVPLPSKELLSSGTVVSEGKVEKLVDKMMDDGYGRARRQVIELSRAKEEAIELDALIRAKEEMLSEVQQSEAGDATLPLRWTSMEMNSDRVTRALTQYAGILRSLSDQLPGDPNTHRDSLDKLRLAYIALAKLVPTRELTRGQWAAWAEYLQQQMAQQKELQSQQQV